MYKTKRVFFPIWNCLILILWQNRSIIHKYLFINFQFWDMITTLFLLSWWDTFIRERWVRSNVQGKREDVNQPLAQSPCQDNVNTRHGLLQLSTVADSVWITYMNQKNQALDINQPALPRKESTPVPCRGVCFPLPAIVTNVATTSPGRTWKETKTLMPTGVIQSKSKQQCLRRTHKNLSPKLMTTVHYTGYNCNRHPLRFQNQATV